MKAYRCNRCPKTEETFDPATANAGTLMLDAYGRLCMRTDLAWGKEGCVIGLSSDIPGRTFFGSNAPFTKATEPWCLEND